MLKLNFRFAGETQACADAASERIQGLEEEAVAQRAEHEEALALVHQQREQQEASSAEAYAALENSKIGEIDALTSNLQHAQVISLASSFTPFIFRAFA